MIDDNELSFTIYIIPLSYHNPVSVSLFEMKFAITTRIILIIELNKPTAVENDSSPCVRP